MLTTICLPQLHSTLEYRQGSYYVSDVVNDALYGAEDGSDLADAMDEVSRYVTLRTWTNEQWCALLRKCVLALSRPSHSQLIRRGRARRYLVDPAYVVLVGKPSAALADKIHADETARVSDQQDRLGDEGRAACAKALADARAEHEREIPREVIEGFPVPDLERIRWLDVQSAQESTRKRKRVCYTHTVTEQDDDSEEEHREPSSQTARDTANGANGDEELARHVALDGEPLPFFLQYDQIKVSPPPPLRTARSILTHLTQSQFVMINVYFSLARLPTRLLPYLVLYRDCMFALPVVHGGVRLGHEAVARALERETAYYWAALGGFGHTLRVAFEVERAGYVAGVAWLRDTLFAAEWDIARCVRAFVRLSLFGQRVLCRASADGAGRV